MKNRKKEIKNIDRQEFRVKLLMSGEDKKKIDDADQFLHERYNLRRNDVLRCFLTNHLSDGRILLLMGFTPKKK